MTGRDRGLTLAGAVTALVLVGSHLTGSQTFFSLGFGMALGWLAAATLAGSAFYRLYYRYLWLPTHKRVALRLAPVRATNCPIPGHNHLAEVIVLALPHKMLVACQEGRSVCIDSFDDHHLKLWRHYHNFRAKHFTELEFSEEGIKNLLEAVESHEEDPH